MVKPSTAKVKINRTESDFYESGFKIVKDIKESFELNDVKFSRSGTVYKGEKIENWHDINSQHFTGESGPIQVRCGKCQNHLFTLSYGDYEISAKCSKCGFDSVVYGG